MIKVKLVQCKISEVPMMDKMTDFRYSLPDAYTDVQRSLNCVPNVYIQELSTPIIKWRENCRGHETETLLAIDHKTKEILLSLKVPELHKATTELFQHKENRLVCIYDSALQYHEDRYAGLRILASNLSNANLWTRLIWLFTGVPKIGVVQ